MADEKVTEKWVYVGRNRLKGDKLGYTYRTVKSDGFTDPEHEHHFVKPLDRWAHVGAVYSVTYEPKEDGGLTVSMKKGEAPKFEYKYPNVEEIVEWEARSEAEEGIHQSTKGQQKKFAEKELLKALRPIRRAMFETNYLGQRLIVARVLEALHRPVRKGEED